MGSKVKGFNPEALQAIEKYDIDLVAHGDDYSDEKRQRLYRDPIELGIFRSVAYTKGISTTEIIRRIESS